MSIGRQNGDLSITRLKGFFREAKKALEEADETEAAFYFEQVAEHLERHPEKEITANVARVLGL